MLGWLAPEHKSEVLTRSQLAQFNRALLQAYEETREPTFRLDDAFSRAGVVRWVGAAMLISVYGISHYEQVLDARALSVARHALDMLGMPGRWVATLWGAP